MPFLKLQAHCLSVVRQNYEALIWESENVKNLPESGSVNFTFLFAMDVSTTPANFILSINELNCVEFSSSSTSKLGINTIEGKNGTKLILNTTMLDKYMDQMGFCTVSVPVSMLSEGKPVQFKVEAKPEENNSWFMVYRSHLEPSVKIYQNKVVRKENNQLWHSMSVDIVHIGSQGTVYNFYR